MVRAAFREIIKAAIGLDAVTIGEAAIAHAVAERMTACHLTDEADYERYLRTCEEELQQLVERTIVPETWFFRDPRAFFEMVRVLETKMESPAAGTLRLLSLPCSTGEEPYSMAMALLDARVPPERFRIDAVDISARAISHARVALYGNNSFRGDERDFIGRYFERTANGHRLRDDVRELVHFEQGNIFSADFGSQANAYDAIFCRNLLVYFDAATQTRALDILRRMLAADGVIFVGPAEAGTMFGHNFVWSKVPFAFAFRNAETATQAARPRAPRRAVAPAPTRIIAPPPQPRCALDEARRLANLGRLDEAKSSCENHLRMRGGSAAAFALLGVIANAQSRFPEAERYFRKAVYLDPSDAGSLVHLALLLEKQNDVEAARLLRARIRRLEPNEREAAL